MNKTTFTISHVWKPHEMITEVTFAAENNVFVQTPSYLHTLFLLPLLLFLPAASLVGLQVTERADGLEAHTVNMQQRTVRGFALLQSPGSAEMSKTCYSPFGNML